MRKVIVFNMMTVDGYFAGIDGDISWHVTDDEFNQFAIAQLQTTNTLLFGKVTYELMANYWPTKAAETDDPVVAGKMNALTKIVFSTTLQNATWNNTRIVKDHVSEEILKLKQQEGKDIFIFGSGMLIQNLIPLGVIDEYRLMINPVILGDGKPLFKNIHKKINLELLNTKIFHSGNVLLSYQPVY